MLAEQLPSLQKSVEAMNAGAENIAGGNAFGTFMIAVIAAPVVEEILFRGIVLRSMRKFTPAWAAILISSVLFGAYHLNIVQAAYSLRSHLKFSARFPHENFSAAGKMTPFVQLL